MRTALVNGRIVTPAGLVEGRMLLLADGRIEALTEPGDRRGRDAAQVDLEGQILAPGFVDVQTNGGGGVLFNDDPSPDSIRAIGAAHRRFGTTGFLPTLISDDLRTIGQAIAAAQSACDAHMPGVLGIHIEGPFLNRERRGIHDARHLRVLEPSSVQLLSGLRGGRTVVTLAPEMTTPELIGDLAGAGVLVCGGHSAASFRETMAAIGSGLRGFTHLFNAMSRLESREPGILGAALLDESTWCGIIVDGHHVDPVVLKLALRCKRHDRFMLVTDAMPPVGSTARTFMLQGKLIRVEEGVCRDENGTLAGAALDMAAAVRNAVTLLGLDLVEAVRMASEYPAAFLGLSHEIGCITAGLRANLAALDEGLHVTRTWIDGIAD